LVAIPKSSVPTTLTKGSIVVVPTGLLTAPAVTSLATFSPTVPAPSPVTPPPVILSTIPSTLPSPPTPTLVAAFPSSNVRKVVHVSHSTVIRTSSYVTPFGVPTVSPPTWYSYVPTSVAVSLPAGCVIPGITAPVPSS
jgi:hypothetical protein